MSQTKIEWATKVWNPVTGCTKASPGCSNCYAERMANRLAGRYGYPQKEPFKVTLHPDRLEEPLKWKKPQRIFVNSMGDLFHDDVPDDYIFQVFNTMANAQWFHRHKFLILTKRPERMLKIMKMIEADIEEQKVPKKMPDGTTRHELTFTFPLQNIWLGVSVDNQETADQRIPLLLQTPASVRFISCEPMLSMVNLKQYLPAIVGHSQYHWDRGDLDWVIAGGESGPGARPMHPDWVRSLRDQCQAANVPFFFKQWGEWFPMFEQPWESDPGGNTVRIVNHDGGHGFHGAGAMWTIRVSKKKAGRLLDGREWNELPGR